MPIKRKLIILALTHLIAMLVGVRLTILLNPQRDSVVISEVAPAQIAVAVSEGCTAIVNVRNLNQRTGPGETYEITGSARGREVFRVEGWDGDHQWILVDTTDGSAWMSTRYVTMSSQCRDLPEYTPSAEPEKMEETFSGTITPTPSPTAQAAENTPVLSGTGSLSLIFTSEVQYWADEIGGWASLYQLDPNLIATVMQIESCGNASISSSAGAQGLFQVMPFHFAPGEDMLDVQTNAQRGLEYLQTGLTLAGGDVGLALAGYNGGHGLISSPWTSWPTETRRYYSWGSRIYAEAISGVTVSSALEEWLASGGSSLCASANQSQQVQ